MIDNRVIKRSRSNLSVNEKIESESAANTHELLRSELDHSLLLDSSFSVSFVLNFFFSFVLESLVVSGDGIGRFLEVRDEISVSLERVSSVDKLFSSLGFGKRKEKNFSVFIN